MSSAHFNGADLGIRRQFLPLFDRYGVDLVLAGRRGEAGACPALIGESLPGREVSAAPMRARFNLPAFAPASTCAFAYLRSPIHAIAL